MEFIQVDYNRELKALETVLAGVKRPGEFYAAGTAEIPMPRVEVEGAGVLSFPVPASQAEALKRHATRAPYGRGEETIVDTSVRNVWQIAPGAVRISGKSWAASLEGILSRVQAGLGCQDLAVTAELYKLLVYERGGFFLTHRDTEKTAGMFGTLVVTLPAAYRGGELRIRHGAREVTVETSASDPSEVSFTAFYADCEHEALPVSEGYRVCLVYNLVQKPQRGKKRIVKAPDHARQIEEATSVLDSYWKAPGAPAKIAWLLEHQYSPASLSFPALKGADAAKCQVLRQAAARAECVAYLGIVHIEESGAVEEYFPRYGRRRVSDYDDDEEMDFTVGWVDSQWQYVDEWRDADDRAVEFGQVPMGDGELLPQGALDKEPPDRRRLTEASGNEGASYERSYHRAALVVWPAKQTISVVLQGGVVAALPYLKGLAAGGGSSHREALAAAGRIVKAWPADPDRYTFGNRQPGPKERSAMISVLVDLKAAALLEEFLEEVVTHAYDGSENAGLVGAAGVLGNEQADARFAALIKIWMPVRPSECSALLAALSEGVKPLSEAPNAAVNGLDRIQASGPEESIEWRLSEPRKRRRLEPVFLSNLFSALRYFEDEPLCEAAAEKIAGRPEIFPPVTLTVPAIGVIRSQWDEVPPAVDEALQRLWTSAAEYLLRRSEVPPEPPADWRLDATFSCTCADCKELQAFARDPSEVVHRFRVNKERRGHLHIVIDRHKLDMTHETERKGSPQTLVCTKDRRTFKARLKEYREEVAAMDKLVKMAPDGPEAAGLSKRMAAAVGRVDRRSSRD